MVVAALAMLPVECVVRGYITGSGWKDYQAHRRGLRASSCRPGCASPSSCPSRSSRRRPRPRSATTTRTSTSRAPSRALGDRDAGRAAPRRLDRGLRARRRARPRARDHPRRHEVRVRARRRRHAGARRRGAARPTPRASGRPTSYEPGRGAAELRQAVRPRLGDRQRLGPHARRRRRSPTTSSHGTRARYIEAYERIVGEPFDAWLERADATADRAPPPRLPSVM